MRLIDADAFVKYADEPSIYDTTDLKAMIEEQPTIEQAARSTGCEYCTQGEEMAYGVDTLKRTAHIYLDGNLLTADLYSDSMAVAVCYCPMCGRKLKEDKP